MFVLRPVIRLSIDRAIDHPIADGEKLLAIPSILPTSTLTRPSTGVALLFVYTCLIFTTNFSQAVGINIKSVDLTARDGRRLGKWGDVGWGGCDRRLSLVSTEPPLQYTNHTQTAIASTSVQETATVTKSHPYCSKEEGKKKTSFYSLELLNGGDTKMFSFKT